MRFNDVAQGPYIRGDFDSAVRALQERRSGTTEEAETFLAECYLELLAGERKLPPSEPAELARYVLTFEAWHLYIAFLAKAHQQHQASPAPRPFSVGVGVALDSGEWHPTELKVEAADEFSAADKAHEQAIKRFGEETVTATFTLYVNP